MYPQPRTNRKNSVSLGSTQLWEGKDITLQKSILYLSKHSFRRSDQILTWVLSVCSSISFWCACVCLCSVKMSAGLGFCWWETCCFPQIRPSDGGYGFTLEERNRVPIIKSVEKGSPAEVRLCTTHVLFVSCFEASPQWRRGGTRKSLQQSRLHRIRCCNTTNVMASSI